MTAPVTGLDHCIILVNNLELARERMIRLGFKPAPRGVHSEHMGTHNHCVMLERGYFEVLAVLKPTERNAQWRERLAQREGLAGIALESDDAHAARAAFVAAGIDAPDPVDFERPVELAGERKSARFTVTNLPAAATPGTSMFVCEQKTPELVWLPELVSQPNGAVGLYGLTVVTPDPAALAPYYEKVFGPKAMGKTTTGLRIDTGRGQIDFVIPEGLTLQFPEVRPDPRAEAPYVAALTLDCRSRGATAEYLQERGLRVTNSGRDGVCVDPLDACGVILEFL